MKIINLKAENFKRLKAIDITPKDNTIVISGANTAGKSSVLDSIWATLAGKNGMKGLKKPIRDGEEKAEVAIDLGDLVVKRNWTSNTKSYITIENKDGAIFKSPQAILDNLIGNLSFDPLAFSHMTDKEQKEILLDLVDIKIDLEEWEKDRKEAYEERTDTNRKVKELEGQLAGMEVPSENVPDEEVSSDKVFGSMEAAQGIKDRNDEKRRDYEQKKQNFARDNDEIIATEGEIAHLQVELERQQECLASLRLNIKNERITLAEQNKIITALVDPDMAVFSETMKTLDETNRAVREKRHYNVVAKNLEDSKKESQELTDEIDGMDENKNDAIVAAKFPIDDLGFDDTGVTYKGIPFSQCSAAERLRVSLCIAMAANPKLRVLRITDGSLLDSKNMKIIQDMVKEHDYQCWVEVVDESGKMGIYIEDGEIK